MNLLRGVVLIAQLLDFNSIVNHLDQLLTYEFQVYDVKIQDASFQPNSFVSRIALLPKFLCFCSLCSLESDFIANVIVVFELRGLFFFTSYFDRKKSLENTNGCTLGFFFD